MNLTAGTLSQILIVPLVGLAADRLGIQLDPQSYLIKVEAEQK